MDYPQAEAIDHRAFLGTKADIFIPAALENQITAETAETINVKMVAEGANVPTTPEGDLVLFNKGIFIIPDVLCNAGGVIFSYFEWLQNKRGEFWDLDTVDSKLHRLIMKAYDRVHTEADAFNTDWRTAAYIVALSRHEQVYKNCGIIP